MGRTITKEKWNAYMRAWRLRNLKKTRKYFKIYMRDFRKIHTNYNVWNKENRKKYPERKKAQMKLQYAVRVGKIKKLPCVMCGAKAVAHHPDYNRPLEVVWLCKPHHREVHYSNKVKKVINIRGFATNQRLGYN